MGCSESFLIVIVADHPPQPKPIGLIVKITVGHSEAVLSNHETTGSDPPGSLDFPKVGGTDWKED